MTVAHSGRASLHRYHATLVHGGLISHELSGVGRPPAGVAGEATGLKTCHVSACLPASS